MVNIVDYNVISDIINISNEIYFNTLIDKGKVYPQDFDNLLNTLLQYASLKDIDKFELLTEIEKQDQLFRNDRAKGWFIDRIKRDASEF